MSIPTDMPGDCFIFATTKIINMRDYFTISDKEVFHKDLEYQIRNDIVNAHGEGIQVYRNGCSSDYYLWIYLKECDEAKIISSWNFCDYRYFKSYWIANYWQEVPYNMDGPKDKLGATRRGPDSFNYLVYQIASALLPYVLDNKLLYAELCEESNYIQNDTPLSERLDKKRVIAKLVDKPVQRSLDRISMRKRINSLLGGYYGLASNIQKGLQTCLTSNPQLHLNIEFREFFGDYYDTLPDEEDFMRHERLLLLKHPLKNWEFDRMSMAEIESYNPYTDIKETFQCDTEPSEQQLELYNELLDTISSYILEYGSNRSLRSAKLSLEAESGYYYKGGKAFDIICIKNKDIM